MNAGPRGRLRLRRERPQHLIIRMHTVEFHPGLRRIITVTTPKTRVTWHDVAGSGNCAGTPSVANFCVHHEVHLASRRNRDDVCSTGIGGRISLPRSRPAMRRVEGPRRVREKLRIHGRDMPECVRLLRSSGLFANAVALSARFRLQWPALDRA